MDRPDQDSNPPRPCAYGRTAPRRLPRRGTNGPDRAMPTRMQRLLAVATVTAGLAVGLNALIQALNVPATWWRLRG